MLITYQFVLTFNNIKTFFTDLNIVKSIMFQSVVSKTCCAQMCCNVLRYWEQFEQGSLPNNVFGALRHGNNHFLPLFSTNKQRSSVNKEAKPTAL